MKSRDRDDLRENLNLERHNADANKIGETVARHLPVRSRLEPPSHERSASLGMMIPRRGLLIYAPQSRFSG